MNGNVTICFGTAAVGAYRLEMDGTMPKAPGSAKHGERCSLYSQVDVFYLRSGKTTEGIPT